MKFFNDLIRYFRFNDKRKICCKFLWRWNLHFTIQSYDKAYYCFFGFERSVVWTTSEKWGFMVLNFLHFVYQGWIPVFALSQWVRRRRRGLRSSPPKITVMGCKSADLLWIISIFISFFQCYNP